MTVVVDEAALDGFDARPGGPALAVAVEFVDPTTLTGQDAAAWMRAGFRVRNHADWLLLRAIREACSARADTTDRAPLDEFAPKIAAASLGWSTTTACTRLDLAVGVLERMPALGERMRVGELELAKATAFVTGLEGLTDAQCAEVLATVLDEAPDLPLGQLRDRILSAGYAVDPVWAANRLAAATARARVSTETAPSGAVNLCGRDLDPDLAQDAKHRLRALALEVRRQLRAVGWIFALGYIEARVFVRLMDGTLAGADDPGVVGAVTAELSNADAPNTGPHKGDDGPDDDGPDDGGGPDDSGPDDCGGPNTGPDNDGGPDDGPGDSWPDDCAGPDNDAGPDGGPDDCVGPDDCAGPDDCPNDCPDGGGPDDIGPEDADLDENRRPAAPEPPLVAGPQHSVVFAPGAAVCLELSTLLRLDDAPGTLPGIGPVPGGTVRDAAYARGAASWQVLVHDEHGRLIHLLALRAPPGATRDPRHRRQTVRLTAPAALLHALAAETGEEVEAPELAGARDVVLDEATTTWLRRARDALIASETADPQDHPATTTRERDRRFPGARLAAWVMARDQTCIALGCSRPAEACDLDHTTDWIRGGRTEADDLEALCRHDHRAKHEGGWRYEQPERGRFDITDPTGTRHRVESRVVHPRPRAVTPGYAIAPEAGPPAPPRPDWAPRRTRDGRITQEARATAEHLTRRARRLRGAPPSRYDHDPDF